MRDQQFILPLPSDLTINRSEPVEPEVVEPWLEAVIRLVDDEDHYRQLCSRIAELGKVYRTEVLAPRYIAFFEDVLSR